MDLYASLSQTLDFGVAVLSLSQELCVFRVRSVLLQVLQVISRFKLTFVFGLSRQTPGFLEDSRLERT